MELAFFITAIGFFFINLFLVLRYGMDHPLWPGLIFVAVFIGFLIFGSIKKLDFPIHGFLSYMIAVLVPRTVAFPILRKRAGKLILTYKKSLGKSLFAVFTVIFILLMSFMMSLPHTTEYKTGRPVYDQSYYFEQLPMSILFGLLGVAFIPVIFRKGEFYENGIATPDMQYYPWTGYKSYTFIEDQKKNERFTLIVEGGRNHTFTVHGFSEKTKSILQELLTQKFPNQNPSS